MMSPIIDTFGLLPVPQTTTEPAGAASKARRLRLGRLPLAMALRRSSRMGMERMVQAPPQNFAAALFSGRLPLKKRVCRPRWNITADSVGTATDSSLRHRASGTGA